MNAFCAFVYAFISGYISICMTQLFTSADMTMCYCMTTCYVELYYYNDIVIYCGQVTKYMQEMPWTSNSH